MALSSLCRIGSAGNEDVSVAAQSILSSGTLHFHSSHSCPKCTVFPPLPTCLEITFIPLPVAIQLPASLAFIYRKVTVSRNMKDVCSRYSRSRTCVTIATKLANENLVRAMGVFATIRPPPHSTAALVAPHNYGIPRPSLLMLGPRNHYFVTRRGFRSPWQVYFCNTYVSAIPGAIIKTLKGRDSS